jgi:hypothetical protein
MPSRNTAILQEIVHVLGSSPPDALTQLEQHFKDSLLVVAADINLFASKAEKLLLAINITECGMVLDHLAPQARITIDQSEEAINTIFPDRFVEP